VRRALSLHALLTIYCVEIFLTIHGGWEPNRNRVVVPACQAAQPGGNGSWN
jgi:hypothetical protein